MPLVYLIVTWPLWPLTSTDFWYCQSYGHNHEHLVNWRCCILNFVATLCDKKRSALFAKTILTFCFLVTQTLGQSYSKFNRLVPGLGLRPTIPQNFIKIWSAVSSNLDNRQTDKKQTDTGGGNHFVLCVVYSSLQLSFNSLFKVKHYVSLLVSGKASGQNCSARQVCYMWARPSLRKRKRVASF